MAQDTWHRGVSVWQDRIHGIEMSGQDGSE